MPNEEKIEDRLLKAFQELQEYVSANGLPILNSRYARRKILELPTWPTGITSGNS